MLGAYNIIFAKYFNTVTGYPAGGKSFRISDYKIIIYKIVNYFINKASEAIIFNGGLIGFDLHA